MKVPGFLVFLFAFFFSSCAFIKTSTRPVFYWPLKKYQITRGFSFGKRPYHLGMDLKAPLGQRVFSSHSGSVVYAGKRLSGYGNVVVVEHFSGWASLYAHLQSIKVKQGQRVKTGDLIGTVGKTGRASGVHLHFEIMYKDKALNPLPFLEKNFLK